VRLELDGERHGGISDIHGSIDVRETELFPTLDLPAHPVTCWLSEDDWSQLLESRWLTIARNWRQRESMLASQIRQDRRMPLLSCPSPGLLVLLATLSLFQG